MSHALNKVLQRNCLASLRKHDFERASSLLAELRDEDPLSVETRGLELEYMICRKNYDEARPLADQLVHLFPGSARIHYLAGRLAYAQRRYSDAASLFRESQRIYPHWFTQLFLAKSLTQKGDFDEAEAFLNQLVGDHPTARRDLSWLHERQGNYRRACQEMDEVVQAFPDDEFARKSQQRLRGLCLAPEEIVHELESLRELGETVDENLLPQFVDGLLRTGQGDEARQLVRDSLHDLATPTVLRIAWLCYRLQAFDLSFELFCRALDQRSRDVKMLTALETSARHCNRLAELATRYRELAEQEPHLYGRWRKITAKLS